MFFENSYTDMTKTYLRMYVITIIYLYLYKSSSYGSRSTESIKIFTPILFLK